MKSLSSRILQTIFSHRPLRFVISWRGPRRGNRIALTFDDGPNEHTTPKVLEILEGAGIQATFFVLGREVGKYPDVIRNMARAGHEIALHGFDHTALDMPGQLRRCEQVLGPLGLRSRLFRPPLGRRGIRMLPRIRMMGYRTILWSFDAVDSMRAEGKCHDRVMDYSVVRSGDIILMHDDNPICIEELPALIEMVQTSGLCPATVSRLLFPEARRHSRSGKTERTLA